MLRRLTLRNLVLINDVDLSIDDGLSVLTGETGAGKSILLDGLGLALGARASAGLVATDASEATVAAVFALAEEHPVNALLADHGVAREAELILRRVVGRDGRSRAFANDAPVGVALLKRIGALVVEYDGQAETDGLLDAPRHLALLDGYAGLGAQRAGVAEAFEAWRRAKADHDAALASTERDRAEADHLSHIVETLELLAPRRGEADSLAAERALLMTSQKRGEALAEARRALSDEPSAALRLRSAHRLLDQVASTADGTLDPLMASLERAAIEAEEADGLLAQAERAAEADPERLERVEERLFALRGAARQHGTDCDGLGDLLERAREALSRIDAGADGVQALARAVDGAADAFREMATALRAARHAAAARLDKAVARELRPLKLGHARFETALEPKDDAAWGPDGIDRCRFLLATQSDAALAPLAKIASGGERARLLLALRLCLAREAGLATLVFDEVDRGIGGAVAEAVGARLAKLARAAQVLVVTHSPQVAACGTFHYRVTKHTAGDGFETRVRRLDPGERREEIARMLSGRRITEEARAAAESLIAGHEARA